MPVMDLKSSDLDMSNYSSKSNGYIAPRDYPTPSGPPPSYYSLPQSQNRIASSQPNQRQPSPKPKQYKQPSHNFAPFGTIIVPAAGYRLSDGFPTDLPPSYEQPHTFASHDVTKDDWLRFLMDVQRVARTSPEERLRENFVPEPSPNSNAAFALRGGLLGLGRGGLLGAIIESATSHTSRGTSRAQEPISQLIAEWNRDFWNRRNIEVSLVLKYPQSDYSGGSATYGRGFGWGGRAALHNPIADARRERLAERRALGGGLIADVHSMLGSSQASALRAAADQERYSGGPAWCLVFSYCGPGGAGFASRDSSGFVARP
ncbi:hypothetical protein DICSQDRAFT_183765 [Dichomitus squalens LYAD-421 SS1]|uniref:Uncharacterized protein n=1 Tax=Dichomitus squalens (strain LYAD-421) TaxID=732165 RepID=R7SK93_DICSQ|nr:uncharacterized protein DICSQDRAFT_183765 [Dichomitus squalens LYAD-421 SS1]EJF56559.1 hypothetical protein DICSQDRAFT_183765 [Dichomitus squalens LYAD-421 SS1]